MDSPLKKKYDSFLFYNKNLALGSHLHKEKEYLLLKMM